jgi:hypothetical protein
MARQGGRAGLRYGKLAWLAALAIMFVPRAIMAAPAAAPAAAAPAAARVVDTSDERMRQKLVLRDGRWLVAGGAPAWQSFPPDHHVGPDTEVYDPASKQWQKVPGLSFSENQSVYVNQLRDGRVLFFVVENQDDGTAYSARIWNPGTGNVKDIDVKARAVEDDGVAVLNDGRVLIIDSLGGSAELWDSHTNTVSSSEVTVIENLRWSALPLRNGTVLLVQTVGDNEPIGRRGVSRAAALQWNPATNTWTTLPELPGVPKPDVLLAENDDGTVQVEMPAITYRLAAGTWTATAPAASPASAASQPAASQPTAAQPAPAQVTPPPPPHRPAGPAAAGDRRMEGVAVR